MDGSAAGHSLPVSKPQSQALPLPVREGLEERDCPEAKHRACLCSHGWEVMQLQT